MTFTQVYSYHENFEWPYIILKNEPKASRWLQLSLVHKYIFFEQYFKKIFNYLVMFKSF